MRCLPSLRDGRAAAKPHLGPVPAHDGQRHHGHDPRGRPGPRADRLAMVTLPSIHCCYYFDAAVCGPVRLTERLCA